MEILTLPLSALIINPDYEALFPPLGEEDLRLLVQDIKRSGINTPIFVRENPTKLRAPVTSYTILDGMNRFKIAQTLQLPFVPCTVQRAASEIMSALFSNIHRRQLDPAALRELRGKENKLRQQMQDRLIPKLQKIFHLFPSDVQGMLSSASEEAQEEFVRELRTTVHPGTNDRSDSTTQTVLASMPEPDHLHKIQQLTTQLTELEDQLERDRKSSVSQHNKLTRELQTTQTQRELLQEQIESMQQQVTSAKAEANAARLVADERLGRAESLNSNTPPTPQILLNGLDYLEQLTGTLALYGSKLPILPKKELSTAHTHLEKIQKHLHHLEEALHPPHDAHVPNGRINKTVLTGPALTLVHPNS